MWERVGPKIYSGETFVNGWVGWHKRYFGSELEKFIFVVTKH